MTKIIAVGDRIIISISHQLVGKTFTVGKLLARGAVETTDEQPFEREDQPEVEEATQELIRIKREGDEYIDSGSFNQESQMVTELIEELAVKRWKLQLQ